MAGLMGGKGANLAEMTRLGLPLPTGFTLTTELCREFLREGRLPASLPEQIRHAVTQMEARTGRIFGAPTDPLLVSVRSGARFSMPGPRSGRAAVGWTGSDPRGPAEQSAVTRRHVRKAVGK
jgi:pyruvate,orthophosphate dikinase